MSLYSECAVFSHALGFHALGFHTLGFHALNVVFSVPLHRFTDFSLKRHFLLIISMRSQLNKKIIKL